jgi:hypothetical protein
MTQVIASASTAPVAKGLSLPARIIGVLTSPRATYADVAARPRWLGVLLFVILLGGAATFAFLSTEVGKQALLEQQVRFMEGFGVKFSDAQYQRMEAGIQRAPYTGFAGQAISLPLIALIVAGIALGVFNAILGGDGTFKQVYAVVAHSGVVITLATLFGLPLAYARETMSSTTNLAVFAPFLDESSFPARFLGSIDLFQLWWIVSLSIGLGVLYRKRTGPIATTMIAIYVAIALIIAAIKSAVSGA